MEKGIILCVDDEPAILSTLKNQLSKSFHETHDIHTAISGEEALEMVKMIKDMGGMIEVVISDQMMPGMKGDTLLEHIHGIMPETIKILLTGQAGLNDVVHALNEGGLNYYIGKPWDSDRLTAIISDFVKKFQQTIENQRLLRQLEQRIQNGV